MLRNSQAVKVMSSSSKSAVTIDEDGLTGPLSQLRRAVIDIGSNSVRLVVYDGPARSPLPICNEKALCGLGRGLGENEKLNPAAVSDAMETLTRFSQLINAYDNPPTKVIATAAVREAKDGKSFVKMVEKLGFDVTVLSGEEEAKYAALGVVSFSPDASGLVGDMGGSSLELTSLQKGTPKDRTSLSIGPFHLMQQHSNSMSKVAKHIDKAFDDVDWLKPGKNETLYAVGGAWRAIARLHMGLRHYPLSVLHHYSLSGAEARDICTLIERQSRRSLEEMPGIPRKRLDTLPYAALVMDKLLERYKIKTVQVSAGGVREGVLFEDLPKQERNQDPLLSIARFFANRFSPEPEYGRYTIALTDELFPKEPPHRKRLRKMICLMMDIGSYFHPDHRGKQAFDMALRAPIVGLSHAERLIAARALYRRYVGRRAPSLNNHAISLLSWEDQQYALELGLALRFAAAFAPKVGGPLVGCRLITEKGKLVLKAPADRKPLILDLPEKRFLSLATAMELDSEIIFQN